MAYHMAYPMAYPMASPRFCPYPIEFYDFSGKPHLNRLKTMPDVF